MSLYYYDTDKRNIDPVLSWPRKITAEIMEHLQKTPSVGHAIWKHQVSYVHRSNFLRSALDKMDAKRLAGWPTPDRIEIMPAAREWKRRRYYRRNDEEETDDGRTGVFLLDIDGAPMVFVYDYTYNAIHMDEHIFAVHRDKAQLDAFRVLYNKAVREIVLGKGLMIDLNSGKRFPKPKVSMENVILPADMKDDLLSNTIGFFRMRKFYEDLGLPWKRGILLAGEPGNGKTFFLKALSNEIPYPFCVMRMDMDMRDGNLREMFQRASDVAPCIVVIEDLDRAERSSFNLSTLLNTLDGLEEADGILVISTTNRPERIDPALLARPSRFDRKYTFGLPQTEDRCALLKALGKGRFSDGAYLKASTDSDDFSMATVKETVLGALLRAAIEGRKPEDADLWRSLQVMNSEVRKSKTAMKSKDSKVGFGPDNGENEEFLGVSPRRGRACNPVFDGESEPPL